METWDLYTEDGRRTGLIMTRGEKVPTGYYHMVCDVLIRHTDGDYLLMLRSPEKKVYPGRWESSCGGSALAGEDAITAARRELREETGIVCEELEEISFAVNKINNSIHYSFLGITDCPKDSIALQPGETAGYRWVSEEEFREFAAGDEMIPSVKRYLLPWLKKMGYVDADMQAAPLTVAELVDTAVCPTCYDRSHNFALYGDPADKTLYENDLFTCVLIGAPRAPGHCCIISKAHFKDMMAIPDDLCATVYLFAKKAMNALKTVYGSESVYLCTMCDGPMNHFHVQLIPRYAKERRGSRNFVKPRGEYIHDQEKVDALRELLR